MSKYPKLNTTSLAQELYTPPEATRQIIEFLPKNKIIWEMCYGRGDMADELRANGFEVVGNSEIDCFNEEPELFDIVVTNPPYRNNKDFIERAIMSNKPFAMLIRLEHLGGVRASRLLGDLEFTVLVPQKRINFITPKMREGKNVGGSPFHTVWLTHRIFEDNQQIIYLKEVSDE